MSQAGGVSSSTDAIVHASRNVPTAQLGETTSAVLARIVGGSRFDSVAEVAVLDGTRLAGVAQMEDVLAASPSTPLDDLMDADPPVIGPGEDQEVAAAKAVAHRESNLAVVDSDRQFIGLIPAHRMLGVLLAEHEEDLARLSGYLEDSRSARSASEEGLLLRFWHRFPWLLVGLAAAMSAAALVSSFEESLAANLQLAFFIPGIVYIADAVGTQTETLVVRGLSLGVSVAEVMRKELLTGLALGAALSALALPALIWWVGPEIALTVSLSIWAACAVAAVVAMALPWAFARLEKDPAFGAGPLATVVQDLLSLAIYFTVAAWIVT